jgi:hypothetical protein
MKLIIFFLLLSFSLIGQDNAIRLTVGIEVAPMLHTKTINNLEQGSLTPNFLMTIGSDQLKIISSIGVISRFGFLSIDKWMYAAGYYTVNTGNFEKIEQGAEIELGFNCNIKKDIRFHVGSSIGLLAQGRECKLTFRPLVIGFTYKLI